MKLAQERKIIVTVGPSSFNADTIRKMDESGVDIFRINLSHTSTENVEKTVLELKQWTDKEICLDTEGAQLRTGQLKEEAIKLGYNQIVEFVPEGCTLKPEQIPLSATNICNILAAGDLLKIDFNSLIVQVIGINEGIVLGRVLEGGLVKSNKGISVDRDIDLVAFTQKDMHAFEIAKKLNLTTIALSFASCGEDIDKLRSFFDYKICVISKIESRKSLEHLETISRKTDMLLIDRGDLSRDVPLERIISAQRYIFKKANELSAPVYVATNLMENMITNSKPTRAEIHDVVSTLDSGAAGLVLAAETAIGKYPVECVRMIKRIIDDQKFLSNEIEDIEQLFTLPSDRIIPPHGGSLVQQHCLDFDSRDTVHMAQLEVNDEILSDIVHICEGTYSPLRGFMNLDEMHSVLNDNKLTSGIVWTLPVLLQLKKEQLKTIPDKGSVALMHSSDKECFAILEIESIEKIASMEKTAKKWFGTADTTHPGVKLFYDGGEYLVSGKPYLIKRPWGGGNLCYELTPRQTRDIFNELGCHKVVGFHTRNVIHRGHEYIQRKALKLIGADAIFISPVVGKKKTMDFKGHAIIKCYEEMIRKDHYSPFKALIGTFNTYSRYSGPREAVFTAICRKNYGCSCFIVGLDHTETGNNYSPDASTKIFDEVDTGMEILCFDTAFFCKKCSEVVTKCKHDSDYYKSLDGTEIRKALLKGEDIPEYLMRKDISNVLKSLYEKEKLTVLV